MYRADYVNKRMRGLIDELSLYFSADTISEMRSYLDASEGGVAFELLCNVLFENSVGISLEQYTVLVELANSMGIELGRWKFVSRLVQTSMEPGVTESVPAESTRSTRKQLIYLEILQLILPIWRNYASSSRLHRFRYDPYYPEAELVHNVPTCIRDPLPGEKDVYWLNCQVAAYLKTAGPDIRPFGEMIIPLLHELISLLPTDLRAELKPEVVSLVKAKLTIVDSR